MKRLILAALFAVCGFAASVAQVKNVQGAATQQNADEEKVASIKFEVTTHDFGKFSEASPVQQFTFKFVNVGNAPLVINQAVASCGCTVPKYTRTPVMPGESGQIAVTYNGTGKFPGHFKKTITVRTNGEPTMVRLYIEGDMQEEK